MTHEHPPTEQALTGPRHATPTAGRPVHIPVALEDEHVRLEQLTPAHAPALFAAADQETFAWMSYTPTPWDEDGFRAHTDDLLAMPKARTFAVIAKAAGKEQVVGTTSYLDIEARYRSLEIGWTWLGPVARGTRVNPAMKRLMLTHALETGLFDGHAAVRVTLKTDARNDRSRRAMTKLGFLFEGILRKHRI